MTVVLGPPEEPEVGGTLKRPPSADVPVFRPGRQSDCAPKGLDGPPQSVEGNKTSGKSKLRCRYLVVKVDSGTQ